MTLQVGMVAGEVSGDLLAGLLLQGLRQRWPGVAWVGCVGVGVCASGVEYIDEPALVLMLAALPARPAGADSDRVPGLAAFIRESHRHGIRCVRVVHGKGLGSPGKTPVLKGRVHSWLVQKKEVIAFVQARPAEGGAGALVVLLQPT